MEQTVCSATLACKLQTPVNNPQENMQHASLLLTLCSVHMLCSVHRRAPPLSTHYSGTPHATVHFSGRTRQFIKESHGETPSNDMATRFWVLTYRTVNPTLTYQRFYSVGRSLSVNSIRDLLTVYCVGHEFINFISE
jgi:hypothetical protein